MLTSAGLVGQKARIVLPSWLTKRNSPAGGLDAAQASASLGQSSRASSIGSEAQGKGDSPPGQGRDQHHSQEEPTATANEQSSDRKRKDRAEEHLDADPPEQPRQRKQRLTYAVYLDSRTGQMKQLKDPPAFSWSANLQPPDEGLAGTNINRRMERRMRILGSQPLRKRAKTSQTNAESDLVEWAEGEEGRPNSHAKVKSAMASGVSFGQRADQALAPRLQGAKEAQALTSPETLKSSPMKKGPSLVNLSELASSSQLSGPDTGSIFSFAKTGSQTAQKSQEVGQPSSAPVNGFAPPSEASREGKDAPHFSAFGATPVTNTGPPLAVPPAKEGAPDGSANPGQLSGKGMAATEQAGAAQASLSIGTDRQESAPFTFGSGAAHSSGTGATAAAQTTSSFTLGSAAAPNVDSAPALQGSSMFTFGTNSSTSTLPSASSPALGSSSIQSLQQSSPGFQFGSAAAPAPSGSAQSSQSIAAFSFGSGAAQQSGATDTKQSGPSFSFGSAAANSGQNPQQGPAQTGMQAGGSSGSGFVFGSQPASSGSFAPAVASSSSGPNLFGGGNAPSMPAGNPFAGSSGSAFSTGPQAVQTAGVTQNPFASKSGTNSGLTIGFGASAQSGIPAQGFGSPQVSFTAPNTFGSSNTAGSSPFGMNAAQPASAAGQGSNPFAGNTGSAFGTAGGAASTSFGAAAPTSGSAFGTPAAGGSFNFSNQATAQAAGAFGGTQGTAPSPFGGTPQPSGFGFGMSSGNAGLPSFAQQTVGGQSSNPFGSTQKAFGNTSGIAFGQQTAAQSAPVMGGTIGGTMPGPGFSAGSVPGAMTMGGTGGTQQRRKLHPRRPRG